MANIDDILKKSQAKIEKHGLQKKIKRSGPSRPWQEGLVQSDSVKTENTSDVALKVMTSTPNATLNEQIATLSDVLSTAVSDMGKVENARLNDENTTYNKLTTEPTTVVQQTYNKPASNLQQTYNSIDETYNKPTSQPTTVVQQKPTTVVQHNLQQTSNKPTTKLFASGVNRLSGHGLTVLEILFKKCITNGSRQTGPLSIEAITSLASGPATRTMQTVIYRLAKDGYIFRAEFKAGRGGWTSYEIPQDIYNQMVQFSSKLTTNVQHNLQQTYNKPTSIPTSELTTSAPSKLVSNINNNLTNSLEPKFEKPTWFKDLNFTAVHPIGPMQVNSSIRDLVQERLSPETVQEFLNKFKSWLAQQSRIQNPLAMFCEKLKELAVEGDSAILACMTEEERRIELEFAQQVEKAKAEMALIVKSKEHSANQEFESRFENWYSSTSKQEHEKLHAGNGLVEYGTEIYKNVLKEKFRQQF